MTLEEMVSRYIRNTERVFGEIRIILSFPHPDEEKIDRIIETAKDYLEDAKYYQNNGEFETSLASVAYSEGILDALRLLGVVEFSW